MTSISELSSIFKNVFKTCLYKVHVQMSSCHNMTRVAQNIDRYWQSQYAKYETLESVMLLTV